MTSVETGEEKLIYFVINIVPVLCIQDIYVVYGNRNSVSKCWIACIYRENGGILRREKRL